MVEVKETSELKNTGINSGLRAKGKFLNFIGVEIENQFSTKLKGKFLLIKYTNDKNREEEFLDYVLDTIPIYALSTEERARCNEETIRKLWKTAVKRFVKQSKTGEFGEIILFHLLELLENAVQVVNKMTLKTSGNMHYHGADAIHFGIDGELRILFLGESKTEQKAFSGVLKSALDSINDYDKDKEFNDINLATGYISDDLPQELKNEIKDYLDPTKNDLSKFTQTHAVLIMFEDKKFKELEKSYSGAELVNKVIEKYHEDIKDYISQIEKKVDEYPDLKNRRFLFFVIPCKDQKKLKEKFSEEINNG
jgi:hypothetical protein